MASTFGGANEPDAAEEIAPSGQTMFDMLEAELSQKAQKDPLTLSVPGRPGYTLTFDPTIEFEQYRAWVDKATTKRRGGESKLDPLKLAFTIISHTNVSIERSGVVAQNEDGSNMTIVSTKLHGFLKVPTGAVGAAIQKLYGSDGHVIQASQKVVEAAGYSLDGDVTEVDDDPLAY